MKDCEVQMQKIDSIISELKMIMQENDLSQTWLVNTLKDRCSRNTITTFLNKEETDTRLSTLLMILDACRVELRLETERSREAMIRGDIAAYREETEKLRAALELSDKDLQFFRGRYEELIEKNTELTKMVSKQQDQIEKYMARTEKLETSNAASQEDIRRKDARIVELSKKLGIW